MHLNSSNSYVVDKVVDLKGDKLLLPANGTLVIKEDGCLKNGIIVGRNTRIKCTATSFLDHIHIEGEWNVPEIRSSFFRNVSDDDILKDVFALSSDKIHNTITLDNREYWVTATDSDKFALVLKSNTDFRNYGTIRMRPNGLISYAIVATSGHDISIKGGNYIGERSQHKGTNGEWGHGIRVTNGSSNVSITDVCVRDCWGDGIAVDGNEVNNNVMIYDFTIDNCRRQGISVIYADNCTISNGVITNIHGTEPHLGIDIEPNANGYCYNVTVDNVTIESEKGLGVFSATKDYQVKDVTIKNCTINTTGYSSIYAARCDGVIIKDNTLTCSASGNNPVIAINTGVKNAKIISNKIGYTGDDKSYCCIFSSGENTLIEKNTVYSSAGVAFYTSGATITENTITIPEFMTYANNATSNTIQLNKVYGNLSCAAGENVFKKNVFNGDVKLNGNNCIFDENEVLGKTVSGTPSDGQFVNNTVTTDVLFELNGNVKICSNTIRSPKVLLKARTVTTDNMFIQTKDNDTDRFITLYGDSFENNRVSSKLPVGSRTVTYIYCTSDGTTISNNDFREAPGINYWLYSSKDLKLNNNRPAKKQIYQAGSQTITE